MENDIHNFTRKLRLTEYFANQNDIIFGGETKPLLKSKDTFNPHPPIGIETKRLLLFLAI